MPSDDINTVRQFRPVFEASCGRLWDRSGDGRGKSKKFCELTVDFAKTLDAIWPTAQALV